MTRADDKDLNNRNRIMQTETEAILSDPSFRRSPTLSKLLQFLVDETIAGRGEGLKSYTLAVDALGRAEDYDPSSDSSARVQMIRLRKALESYYAKNPPKEKLCIYLQAGSYLVRVDEPALAYPTLYRLNADSAADEASDPLVSLRPKPPVSFRPQLGPVQKKRWAPFLIKDWRTKKFAVVAALIAIFAIGAIVTIVAMSRGRSTASYPSPVIKVMTVEDGGRSELAAISALVRSSYENDLPQFKLARVRLAEDNQTAMREDMEPESYHLNSRIVLDGPSSATLFLNISDVLSDTILWTRRVPLSLEPAEARSSLIPLLGEINGPIGAIALHQTKLTRSMDSGGYPCLLKYFEFIRTRSQKLEERLESCLEKPVTEDFLAATVLGVRGMFELERPAAQQNFNAAIARGLKFAREGVAIDPNDAWANFAMARLSYAAQDCRSALVYTSRTMESNPNSPIFPAVLASLSPVCKYPKADEVLDQALLTQSPLYIRSRLLLVQAAIYNNRPDKIARIKDSELPETNIQKRYYYATETFIAASRGKPADANRNWQLFSAVSDPDATTADAKMSAIIVIPALRAYALDYLRQAGVQL